MDKRVLLKDATGIVRSSKNLRGLAQWIQDYRPTTIHAQKCPTRRHEHASMEYTGILIVEFSNDYRCEVAFACYDLMRAWVAGHRRLLGCDLYVCGQPEGMLTKDHWWIAGVRK